jgi:hypothetical protein
MDEKKKEKQDRATFLSRFGRERFFFLFFCGRSHFIHLALAANSFLLLFLFNFAKRKKKEHDDSERHSENKMPKQKQTFPEEFFSSDSAARAFLRRSTRIALLPTESRPCFFSSARSPSTFILEGVILQ